MPMQMKNQPNKEVVHMFTAFNAIKNIASSKMAVFGLVRNAIFFAAKALFNSPVKSPKTVPGPPSCGSASRPSANAGRWRGQSPRQRPPGRQR